MEYFTVKNFLTEDECDEILLYSIQNLKLHNALVGTKNLLNNDLRKSSISFENYDNKFPYIKNKLLTELSKLTITKGYQINFETEAYQFTKYDTGQYYNWHIDDGNNGGNTSNRYCSIVIQLNDGYTGGDLQMKKLSNEGESIITFETGKGNLHVFLSNIIHRVSEITDGTRYSLVNWFKLKEVKDFKKTLI